MQSKKMNAAETVANIEDVLKQILEYLPVPSLFRFKCVSKDWRSLISSPDFYQRKVSAFLSRKTGKKFKFIPDLLGGSNSIPSFDWNPFKNLDMKDVPQARGIDILQSCNGLFLCGARVKYEVQRVFLFGVGPVNYGMQRVYPYIYVVNPTTSQILSLGTPPSVEEQIRRKFYGNMSSMFIRYGLAFEPSKSPHYKVVCVCNYDELQFTEYHYIDIYSSDTKLWKSKRQRVFQRGRGHEKPFRYEKPYALRFDDRSRHGAVYYNGAIHWVRDWIENSSFSFGGYEFDRLKDDVLHYYVVDQERLRVAKKTPPIPLVVRNILLQDNFMANRDSMWPKLLHRYFGASGGHLYLIETYKHCSTQFEVMEMKKDYSGWVVKYFVDLDPVFAALPQHDSNGFVILLLSLKEEKDNQEDDSSSMLLHTSGRVVSYNLMNKTFNTSAELTNKELILDENNYPYMESLASV